MPGKPRTLETTAIRRDDMLIGREEIAAFVRRSWRIISRWIAERGFPATEIDGRWESDSELVLNWRRSQIRFEKNKT